jgi:subtilisin family serine protease
LYVLRIEDSAFNKLRAIPGRPVRRPGVTTDQQVLDPEKLHRFMGQLQSQMTSRLPNSPVLALEMAAAWQSRSTPPSGPPQSPWGLLDVHAPEALARIGALPSTALTPVTVAVLDSGVDMGHAAFAGMTWGIGRNVISGAADPSDTSDTFGHGTRVAGIVAGADVGVASSLENDVQMVAVKMTADGALCTDDILAAVTYAADPKVHADILNLSASSCSCSENLRATLHTLAQTRKTLLVVTAVTNVAEKIGLYPDYPASYQLPNVLAVQASDRNNKWYRSGYDSSLVDMAAPGLTIMSSTIPSSNYDTDDGTSFAAPHVSGAAALLKALAPNWGYSEIRTYLQDSAQRPENCAPTHVAPSTASGTSLCGRSITAGVLDVDAATSPPVMQISVPTTTLIAGSNVTVSWQEAFKSRKHLCDAIDVAVIVDSGGSGAWLTGIAVNKGTATPTIPNGAGTAHVRFRCSNPDAHNLYRDSPPFTVEPF